MAPSLLEFIVAECSFFRFYQPPVGHVGYREKLLGVWYSHVIDITFYSILNGITTV